MLHLNHLRDNIPQGVQLSGENEEFRVSIIRYHPKLSWWYWGKKKEQTNSMNLPMAYQRHRPKPTSLLFVNFLPNSFYKALPLSYLFPCSSIKHLHCLQCYCASENSNFFLCKVWNSWLSKSCFCFCVFFHVLIFISFYLVFFFLSYFPFSYNLSCSFRVSPSYFLSSLHSLPLLSQTEFKLVAAFIKQQYK